MSLSDKSCLEESGKQENIVLEIFFRFPFSINKKFFEYFFPQNRNCNITPFFIDKKARMQRIFIHLIENKEKTINIKFCHFSFFLKKWDSHYLYNNFIITWFWLCGKTWCWLSMRKKSYYLFYIVWIVWIINLILYFFRYAYFEELDYFPTECLYSSNSYRHFWRI